MRRPNASIEDIEAIVRRSKAGERHADLAREYGYSFSGITRIVQRHAQGATHRRRVVEAKRKAQIASIHAALDAGMVRTTDIAKAAGLTLPWMYQILRSPDCTELRATIAARQAKRREARQALNAEIRRKYADGATRKELAVEYGMSYSLIGAIVTEYGTTNLRWTRKAMTELREKAEPLIRDTEMSYKQIAGVVGATGQQVATLAYKMGYRTVGRRMYNNKRASIASAIEDGYTDRYKIAEATGISYGVVCKVLRRYPELATQVPKRNERKEEDK